MEQNEGSESEVGGLCYITRLSAEILLYIFSLLDAKSIARASQTCARLNFQLKYCDPLWRELCRRDYELSLRCKAPFTACYDIYRFLAMSRVVLRIYLSERFYASGKYGILPGWLWTWIVFNSCGPRIPRWILTHREPYLRLKVAELPLGRISKTWNIKSGEMLAFRPARSERGTHYYTWGDVHRVALNKLGGPDKLQQFYLKRCFRARNHLEKHYHILLQETQQNSHVIQQPPPVAIATIIGAYGFSSILRTW